MRPNGKLCNYSILGLSAFSMYTVYHKCLTSITLPVQFLTKLYVMLETAVILLQSMDFIEVFYI